MNNFIYAKTNRSLYAYSKYLNNGEVYHFTPTRDWYACIYRPVIFLKHIETQSLTKVNKKWLKLNGIPECPIY